MTIKEIQDRAEYNKAMRRIEALLEKSTKEKGFENLSEPETKELQELSVLVEKYEDSIPLMPIKKPTTLTEMLRLKMFELNIKQKQLANILEVPEPRISELLRGKTNLNIKLAKKLHEKLGIDGNFILEAS